MAQPADTHDSYDAVGIREDLTDVIHMISPTRTPAMMMAGRGKAKNTYHEWQTDELAAVDLGNAVIEGDDATTNAIVPTTRVGNHCQISDKVIRVTGTVEEVNKAGRKREMAREMRKKAKELKRDMEAIMFGNNQASAAGNSATARNLGAFINWLETNVSRGAGGASGGFSGGTVSAVTDGTVRGLTEDLVKDLLQSMWVEGAEAKVIMAGPKTKQKLSTFDGSGTIQRRENAPSKRLTTAIDVYVSDFGDHRIIPNRWTRDRDLLFIDPDYVKITYLRGFRQHPLAKTGDSNQRQLLVEYTPEVCQESAHGIVADIDVNA